MVTLSDEALDRAVTRTLTQMFELGMFENTYRDAQKAREIVTGATEDWAAAELAHRQSVVLLKNDGTLPLNAEEFVALAYQNLPSPMQESFTDE